MHTSLDVPLWPETGENGSSGANLDGKLVSVWVTEDAPGHAPNWASSNNTPSSLQNSSASLLFLQGEGRVVVLPRFTEGETETQESVEPKAAPHSHTRTPTGSQRSPAVPGALCDRLVAGRKEPKPGWACRLSLPFLLHRGLALGFAETLETGWGGCDGT